MAAISQPSRSPSLNEPLSHSASNKSTTIFTRSVLQQAKPRVLTTASAADATPTPSSAATAAAAPLPNGPLASLNSYRQQQLISSAAPPPAVVAKVSKGPGGLLGSLVAAFDKTQHAFVAISEPKVRRRQSLGRLSTGTDTLLTNSSTSSGSSATSGTSAVSAASSVEPPLPQLPQQQSPQKQQQQQHKQDKQQSAPSTLVSAPSPQKKKQQVVGQLPRASASTSQLPRADSEPIPTKPLAQQPPPVARPAKLENKMHQTSSRLLRMTDDDRPFTKDFKDLFSTLVVSLLPLSAHRVRLTRVEHTFLSEDAINNLGSLKFSQSNRMPDPKDPSRIVTTTTTTTFSMAKDMARSICQRFLEARFIESADGKYQQVYTMKGSVWQLTPKGITILDRFCSRNGIQQKQVSELVGSSLTQLVILERDSSTDKLVMDRGTIEVIFRRFIGTNGMNVKSSVSSADSDSLNDYRDGLTGVKIASERKVGGKIYKDTFTGKSTCDWLMDCCTTVDRRETVEIASLFVEYELMEAIQQDRNHMVQYPGNTLFQPTKHAIYHLTAKGRDLVNGSASRGRTSESEGASHGKPGGVARDSNTNRLEKILNDAALRLLFRENLRETHCEENLSFYLDVDEFVRNCRAAIRLAQKNPGATSMDGIKEIMAQAYGIYNAFLAPGSPCELNIDHQLRNNLATRMTKAVGQDIAMIDTLHEVTSLFEDAQNAVFKLMASDSVPKFLRSPKYEQTLKHYDFDSVPAGSQSQSRLPERSQSRSNRK